MWLRTLGAQVAGLGLPPEADRPSLFAAAQVADGVDSHFGDVRDDQRLRRLFAAAAPEIVFHLAAQALVRRSYAQPLETFATNVQGTANVLEAARRCPSVRTVVVITTDKCYRNDEWHWSYRENDPLGGHDPYSASKACAELVTAAYRQSFFSEPETPAVATARAGNVIGGGDWSQDRLVPDIVATIARDEAVVIRNPGAIRPWQHVLDPLCGYLLLGQRLLSGDRSYCEAWNFGPDEYGAANVQHVAERLVALWAPDA